MVVSVAVPDWVFHVAVGLAVTPRMWTRRGDEQRIQAPQRHRVDAKKSAASSPDASIHRNLRQFV
jgi:hypothetical protein